MRRNLLGTNSLKEGLPVVHVGKDHGVLFRVIRMNIPLLHSLDVSSVVALAVFLSVFRLNAIRKAGFKNI